MKACIGILRRGIMRLLGEIDDCGPVREAAGGKVVGISDAAPMRCN